MISRRSQMTPLQQLLYDEYLVRWGSRNNAMCTLGRLLGALADARTAADARQAALERVHSLLAENGIDPTWIDQHRPVKRPAEYVLTGHEAVPD